MSNEEILAAIPNQTRAELTKGIALMIAAAVDENGTLIVLPMRLAGEIADAVLTGAARGKLNWKGNGK